MGNPLEVTRAGRLAWLGKIASYIHFSPQPFPWLTRRKWRVTQQLTEKASFARPLRYTAIDLLGLPYPWLTSSTSETLPPVCSLNVSQLVLRGYYRDSMDWRRLQVGSGGYSQERYKRGRVTSTPRSHLQGRWCETWGRNLHSGPLIPFLSTTRRRLPRLSQFRLPGLTS